MNKRLAIGKVAALFALSSVLPCMSFGTDMILNDCTMQVQVQANADLATAQAACKIAQTSDYGVTCLVWAVGFNGGAPESPKSIAEECNQIKTPDDLECVEVDIYTRVDSVRQAAGSCSILLK